MNNGETITQNDCNELSSKDLQTISYSVLDTNMDGMILNTHG